MQDETRRLNFRLGRLVMGASAMSYAEWKDLGVHAVGLISREPPPAQIFIWLSIAFLVLMVIEGLRANFLPARRSQRGSSRALRVQSAMYQDATFSREASGSETASVRRPTSQLRNHKRLVGEVRRTQAFRPGIRRIPNALDWQGAVDAAESEATVAEHGDKAPILFEPMEPPFTQH
jgi:hypothetical protein